MRPSLCSLLLLACVACSSGTQPQKSLLQTAVYLNPEAPIEERVEDALHRMTLEEKVAVLHAQSKFSSAGVPRLGIPEVWTSDGPHGIRQEVLWNEWYGAGWTNDSCIAFPALTCLAATWNPEMASLYGKSIGEEARFRNKSVLLGPGINIHRTPLNGRNFEYMGEDPYLAARMVVPYVQGVQRNGVAACVKHFALNNQEQWRGHINVEVSSRALHEIYLPAFKAAVQKGKAWAIMGAYNQYKNQHACHNETLLKQILKRDWGFDGVVISDWGGTHSTEQAISNGLDMEFGTWTSEMSSNREGAYSMYYLANPYLKLLREGKASEDVLNDKVRRVLRLIFRTTMSANRPFGSFGSPEHALAGRIIASEGIVLLKNDGAALPVDLNSAKNILVVGENAVKRMTIGGGSSSLKAKYEVSPLAGIRELVGDAATVTYVKGYESPAVREQDVKGAKQPDQSAINLQALRREAVSAARKADAVIFVGGLNKNGHQDCEGVDRLTYDLPYEQDALIDALADANPRTVVVLVSGTAVAMPWADKVPAIVEAWYNGTEAGGALADVLFGKVNPSGKLPFSFPKKLTDNGAHADGNPLTYPGDNVNVRYAEDILVGYRWLNSKGIRPLFPFGHGLSYTTFEYGAPAIDRTEGTAADKFTVSLTVSNTGKLAGAEVVQLYVADKQCSVPRPPKELKGFAKINLRPGESRMISFPITADELSFYDEASGQWTVEPGEFEALLGASSEDIRGRIGFKVVR